MIKVFLDTNVLLDTIVPGRPNCEYSRMIMSLDVKDGIRKCISMQSVADTAYVIRKLVGKAECIERIRTLFKVCSVLPMTDIDLYDALRLLAPDFEDALQLSCAENESCDCIVTGNVKHFAAFSTIPVYSPLDFLSRLKLA